MGKQSLEQQVIYEAPCTQITSLEQARSEVIVLRKAFFRGVYNKMIYINSRGGGFYTEITRDNIERRLKEIVRDAKAGKLPSKYGLGENSGLEEEIKPETFKTKLLSHLSTIRSLFQDFYDWIY